MGNLNSIVEAASDALAEASGRIVVLGSALGLLPSRRNPLGGLADEALFTLVRETAMRLGSRKVRINGVALGAIVGAPGSTLLTGDEGLLSHAADKRPGDYSGCRQRGAVPRRSGEHLYVRAYPGCRRRLDCRLCARLLRSATTAVSVSAQRKSTRTRT